MSLKIESIRKEYGPKHEKLENARTLLKQEFVGLDSIIDDLINYTSSWYAFNAIQDKPFVINLWGLTGVGKTSLVNRLVDLINFSDRYFRFDLGEKNNSMSFNRSLNTLCENKDESPVIIALDEFQHTRTIKQPFRQEIEDDKNRMVWELIDSGNVSYIDWKSGIWSFENMLGKLSWLVKEGVESKNGMVTSKKELFKKEMSITEEEELIPFVPVSFYNDIIEFGGDVLKIGLQKDVQNLLAALDELETIDFLFKVLQLARRPSNKNFNKSLIFVLGNIDEAYTMSGNFSADIDADQFHEISLKITIPKLKKALRDRFRDEQIARLGNIHIIYPALNKKAYQRIIKMELEKTSTKLSELLSMEFEFDSSVEKQIYKEGVFPTQGVRPIFTTVQQIIKSKLSLFLSEMLTNNLYATKLKFSIKEDFIECNYFFEDKIILTKSDKLISTLEHLRKNRKDDLQAITAVHESGHALLSAILLKVIPEMIYSVSSDADSHGFIYTRSEKEFLSKNELVPKAAMFLGGLVAEELIFGNENITSGSSKDLEMATAFVSEMLKENGFGNHQIYHAFHDTTDNHQYHITNEIEQEVKSIMILAKSLAETTLKREKNALLLMADYLADHTKMQKIEIKHFVEFHLTQKVNFEEKLFNYRNHLKHQIAESDTFRGSQNMTFPIFLNKGE
jgi:cell division protease FtsH